MANVIIPPEWQLPEKNVTPEADFLSRRQFLKRSGLAFAGLSALAIGGGLSACVQAQPPGSFDMDQKIAAFLGQFADLPNQTNSKYQAGRAITSPEFSTRYNNAYEFTTDKEKVWKLAKDFTMKPWQVEVGGLCERKGTFEYTDIVDMKALEERRYRHRCVEAWAMTVPWVGYPLRKFIEWAKPMPQAKYVRFISIKRPSEMVGQRTQTWYNWPYYEALRLDEAMNELTMLVVGMYGKELSPQNGGPIRVVTPWKYGYKSPKYIARIEFTDKQPHTFWNDLAPNEYSFLSNVNPKVPHPRWSQARERLIGQDNRMVDTQPYNGYGEYVAGLYS
ncbi:protein-methionine-sulfoxide reductase catalytic subunit MsrP [bacterium]|nr:protein-methionine-sulfoxide reductase catalytic subunit MsrP [bacterium]